MGSLYCWFSIWKGTQVKEGRFSRKRREGACQPCRRERKKSSLPCLFGKERPRQLRRKTVITPVAKKEVKRDVENEKGELIY